MERMPLSSIAKRCTESANPCVTTFQSFYKLLGIRAISIGLLFLVGMNGSARADFILYTFPGSRAPLVLEGKVRSQSSSIVDFVYPGFPSVSLARENVVVVKSPSKVEEYRRLLTVAQRSKSVDDYLAAAEFAIRGSKLREFYECCSAAYKIAPDNPTLHRLIEARKRIRRPVSGFSDAESKLRQATNQPSMKIARSNHYVMLHDLPSRNSKNPRVEKRLELLEQVYEAFILKFAFLGVVLDPPTEPLMICLFSEERDYFRYATSIDPSLKDAAGFWSPADNIATFYDRGTTEEMKKLTKLIEDLRRARTQAKGTPRAKEIAQLSNSLDLIVKIAKDESDVEVVSHEATHQLAGSTGLMPRDKLGMLWSHEGLASYFETPAGGGWGGVGSINAKRLRGYRSIAGDPRRNKLELLISDFLFDGSSDTQSIIDAYGGAWALTHYLMQKYPLQLVDYYRQCAELSTSEGPITRQQTVDIFKEVFGGIEKLEQDFAIYMSQQQSQSERLMSAIKE